MKPGKDRPDRRKTVRRIKNGAVILVMVLGAAALMISGITSKAGRTASGRVRVLVDGEVYTEQDIRSGNTITVARDGCENVIMMTDNGFYMLSATCSNQDCVHQGRVTEDNYMFRALGTSIICIPNRVEVQLVLSEDSVKPDFDVPDV